MDKFEIFFKFVCLFNLVFILFWLPNPDLLPDIFHGVFDIPIIGFAFGIIFDICLIKGALFFCEIIIFFIPKKYLIRFYREMKKI